LECTTRRRPVKRSQRVAVVILSIDAPSARCGYRRYVADHLAQRPPRGPARAAVNQRPWLAIAVLAACTALAALAIMATRTPALGQRIPLVMGAGILIMAL